MTQTGNTAGLDTIAQAQMHSAFAHAYVAVGYLLGARNDALLEGLADSPRLNSLTEHLNHSERQQRAAALAFELTLLAQAVLRQRLK